MADLLELLGDALPRDHARQVTLDHVAAECAAALAPGRGHDAAAPLRVLDLGCGDGRSIPLVEALASAVDYLGVDIADSEEVRARTRRDPRLLTYDGVNLPFADQSFDIVWSRQVFEHVRHPEALLREIFRVLALGGFFAASASFLEPYHSRSIFHCSPYGMFRIVTDAGLEMRTIRPGIDGVTLTLRRVLGRRAGLVRRWFSHESPVNRFHDLRGRRKGVSVQRINAWKLETAGHLIFAAQRP